MYERYLWCNILQCERLTLSCAQQSDFGFF